MTYIPRIADEILAEKLLVSGAVQIKGTKWCGKTTTARQQAKTVVLMDDPEEGERNRSLASSFPKEFLKQEAPLLIDEWQFVPQLWDSVRHEVDRRNEFGQFILTGSVSHEENEDEEIGDTNKIFHSGVGRIASIKMRPMTLFETGFSVAKVSLLDLFNGSSRFSVGLRFE